MSLAADIAQLDADSLILHQVIHGLAAAADVTTEGGPLPTLAKTLLRIATGLARGTWTTATAYVLNDQVVQGGLLYRCVIAHTSGTFATDLTAAKWSIVAAMPEYISAKVYGCVGDGTADDRASIAAADAAAGSTGEIYFPAGTYKIASNLTIAAAVRFAPGAKLSVPTGVTVTISRGITAGVQQIFSLAGTGIVALNPAFVLTGYPEWWGAVTGGPDCLAALGACIKQCPVTLLQAADYFISAELLIQTGHRSIRGASPHYTGAADGSTRIVVTSGSAHVVRVQGPSNVINNFLQRFSLSDIELTRSVAPIPVASGNEPSAPSGLWMQYVLYGQIDRVRCSEHQVGFSLQGTCNIKLRDCYSFRSASGTGANVANDTFRGYWLNGLVDIGAAGGNASTYFTDCNAGVGGSPALVRSIGYFFDHAFVDTFILRPEVANCTRGFEINGTSGDSATLQKTGNVDLHIVDPIIDTFTEYGILIQNLSTWAAVDIRGGYSAPSGASPQACIALFSSGGMTHITHHQGVMWPGATTVMGLYVNGSSGVISRGNQWLDSQRPVTLLNATHCVVEDQIRNNSQNCGQGAVYLSGSSRCVIKPVVSGDTTRFGIGIALVSTGNSYCELNPSGIDPAALTGGSANKVTINAVQITATGLSGNHLVAGVMN